MEVKKKSYIAMMNLQAEQRKQDIQSMEASHKLGFPRKRDWDKEFWGGVLLGQSFQGAEGRHREWERWYKDAMIK